MVDAEGLAARALDEGIAAGIEDGADVAELRGVVAQLRTSRGGGGEGGVRGVDGGGGSGGGGSPEAVVRRASGSCALAEERGLAQPPPFVGGPGEASCLQPVDPSSPFCVCGVGAISTTVHCQCVPRGGGGFRISRGCVGTRARRMTPRTSKRRSTGAAGAGSARAVGACVRAHWSAQLPYMCAAPVHDV